MHTQKNKDVLWCESSSIFACEATDEISPSKVSGMQFSEICWKIIRLDFIMNERLDKLKKGNWTNVIQNTHMVCTFRRMEPCILDHRIQILEMGNLKKTF